MKKFRVGIVGCGNIFPMHASSLPLTERAELAAVCDVKSDRAQKMADKYGCPLFENYDEMLAQAQLDVVHVCTPHFLHPPMVIAAAQARKHVLTEKPMSIALADAKAMIDACDEHHVTLGVIFQNRYNPGARLIKDALLRGDLGRILGGKCAVTWKRTDEYYSRSDWKGTWDKEGGGVLIDQAIHTMDLVRWFVGENIEYVDAAIANRAHERIEVEDSAEGVLKWANGIFTSFHTINYYSYDAPVEIELHCENGVAKMVGDKATLVYNNGQVVSQDVVPGETMDYGEGVKAYWGVSHAKQIKEFYEALAENKTPFIDGRDAYKTQEMICAIYQSGKEKKRVHL